MKDCPTIFLVDDDPSILRANARALQTAGYAVESFESALDFLARMQPQGPCCLVIDLAMPQMSGHEVQEALNSRSLPLPIVFLSGQGDVRASVKAMKAGAVDFLEKPASVEQLLNAVSGALTKHQLVLTARDEIRSIQSRFGLLTPREKEVAVLVSRGLMNKQIASELGAAEKTVKIHRSRVMRKLDVRSVPELVRLLDRIGRK